MTAKSTAGAAIAAALLLTDIAFGAHIARASQPSLGLADASGIHVITTQRVDARLLDVTMSTHALDRPVHAAVLLPTGYASHPSRRYPVVYLLHGAALVGIEAHWDDYLGWTRDGDAESITAGTPVIVVMPEGGPGGFYTDWYNGGRGGPPEWETYHVDELIPWVDRNFRTIASRNGRAIAGLSMGGFGSMAYASRHPDLFVASASFSGAPDIADPPQVVAPVAEGVVGALAVEEGGQTDSTFGSFSTEELQWRAHDPSDLAANLGHTALFLYTGNGQPGPLDPPAGEPAAVSSIEQITHLSTTYFAQALRSAGVPFYLDDYGPGTHTWPYWSRDFADALPRIMRVFAKRPGRPSTITYTTADPSYSVWGWRVALRRPAGELSTLSDAGRAGFGLSGSGSARVTTPGVYRPGSDHRVVEAGAGFRRSGVVRADSRGSVTVSVPLGPGNPHQEYSAVGLDGTRVFTTSVGIA